MTTRTTFLKNFLNDVGNSVHSMNTISVALSNMTASTNVPKGLNISWNIGNLQATKEMSRNFVIRSAIAYTVEALYEYLKNISKSPLWTDIDKVFSEMDGDGKAVQTYNFLKGIDNIEEEWTILVELLGHWRNKVVHSHTSNAKLSASKKRTIKNYKSKIKNELHSFDIDEALNNFENNKNTLKDVSTLISVAIKCARVVENYYIAILPDKTNIDLYVELLKKDESFYSVCLQQKSDKKTRQIKRWLEINYDYLSPEVKDGIINEIL
ncbi:MAG: hypothetical protein M0Q24_01390 [Sulfurimonas sp.]|uniref:hypothetical protein n=1 Tax=Sulfurimonas sp. TaxID=2022749 RepID=UPI0025E1BD3C|nr:hypothetical protein [Sulfurimonas sp.]MCK9490716.1 hypothetical protein [Sulfurimonas sp.]